MNREKIISIILLSFLLLPSSVLADEEKIQTLQTQIQSSQTVIQSLDAEIETYQKQLNQVAGERRTLESSVRELTITNRRIESTIQSTSLKIADTEKNLENISLSISELEANINRNKFLITQYIQAVNEMETRPILFSLAAEKELGDMVRVMNSYQRMRDVFNQEIHSFTRDLERLGVAQKTKEGERINFESLIREKSIEQESIAKVEEEKKKLLSETRSEESEYQKILNEKLALKKQFEESLQTFESELEYILNPSSYPEAAFGIFSWPLKNILITQPFGLTPDSKRLYSYRTGAWSGRHTGVDFRANNDKVYAMGNGTVVDFGNTDLDCPRASFGGWMLIRYDNGLSSIYSHLASFTAQKGQRVTKDTIVAISGNTGYSTGPHLDVKIVPTDAVSIQTWPSKGCPGKNYTTPIVAGSTYFDPLGYLPKATPDMFK